MYRKIFSELIYLDYLRPLSETRNSNDTNSILLLISLCVMNHDFLHTPFEKCRKCKLRGNIIFKQHDLMIHHIVIAMIYTPRIKIRRV